MAVVSETAVLGGGHHPLHNEIAELADAVASPEKPGQRQCKHCEPIAGLD